MKSYSSIQEKLVKGKISHSCWSHIQVSLEIKKHAQETVGIGIKLSQSEGNTVWKINQSYNNTPK